MPLPFTSLNAATSTGPGATRDLEGVSSHHTMLVHVGGTLTNYGVVSLEGPHDNSSWVSLGSVNAYDTPVVVTTAESSAPLIRYVRANLITMPAGTSVTVTATIASDVEEED